MAGGILGVVVPEAEGVPEVEEFPGKFEVGKFPGILGTELAVGKLRLGDAGVELTDIKDGVAVRF